MEQIKSLFFKLFILLPTVCATLPPGMTTQFHHPPKQGPLYV